jgi:hypothetical protein
MGLRSYLDMATCLTTLNLRMDSCDDQGEYDMLEDFLQIRGSRLRMLRMLCLTSSYTLLTSKASIERILINFAGIVRLSPCLCTTCVFAKHVKILELLF